MVLIWRDPTRGKALSLVVIGIKTRPVAWIDVLNIRHPIRKFRYGKSANPRNRAAAKEQYGDQRNQESPNRLQFNVGEMRRGGCRA